MAILLTALAWAVVLLAGERSHWEDIGSRITAKISVRLPRMIAELKYPLV